MLSYLLCCKSRRTAAHVHQQNPGSYTVQEVEGGPSRISIVSRMREQNDDDCKRHSDSHDIHRGFEGRDSGPDYECFQLLGNKGKCHCGYLEERIRDARLTGIMKKGKAQDGKADGHDCMIRG
jgi:hypothetical protein